MRMTSKTRLWCFAVHLAALAWTPLAGHAEELHARLDLSGQNSTGHAPAAVLWMTPVSDTKPAPPPPGHFVLAQKNRMFVPHLLVIPQGSIVDFPNEDPFFHNVFSLFNGKRFDLGLYEAGKSKRVVFSREGISYIFCNIHPEMSAVVLSLDTPYYAIADHTGAFRVDNLPPGEYAVHIWVEGWTQGSLDELIRHVRLGPGLPNSITIDAKMLQREPSSHTNKFGNPYQKQPTSPY
jgi:plastocyanin